MRRLALFFILVFVCFQSVAQYKTVAVLYGKYDSIRQTDGDDFMRIFLDKNGDFYPETNISDEELVLSNNNLLEWAQQNPVKFVQVSSIYELNFGQFTEQNFDELQDSVIARILKKLNQKSSSYNSINLVIHGFRKPVRTRTVKTGLGSFYDSWSYEDNKFLRTEMNKISTSNFFLEVYWDGSYDCCLGTNFKKNKEIFELFEKYSFESAVKAGYSLRKIVSKIDHSEINIISHSAGATVATSLLFNTNQYLVDSVSRALQTPRQKEINICLVAPAISKKPFEDYYSRNTNIDFTKEDNYSLSVIYNKRDFALRKKDNVLFLFGPGVKKYGNTALGCDYHGEIARLEQMFVEQYQKSPIHNYKVKSKMNHYFTFYITTNQFVEWVKR